MNLDSAVCIVTGAAVGVGAACAVQLARKGANVVINYSKSEIEARATQALCLAAGSEAIVVQGSVANDADCKRIAQVALDKWGRIDGLINNAGITKFVDQRDLDGIDAEDFQRIYAVNVVGPGRAASPSWAAAAASPSVAAMWIICRARSSRRRSAISTICSVRRTCGAISAIASMIRCRLRIEMRWTSRSFSAVWRPG